MTMRQRIFSSGLTTLQGEQAGIDRPSQVRNESSTVARFYRLLRPIFTTAVDDEVLPRNPCKIKGAGDAKATERPTLSVPQVQELTQAMPEHYRALVQLLVRSGIRIGEAAAFQRKDLQLSINAPLWLFGRVSSKLGASTNWTPRKAKRERASLHYPLTLRR